MSSPLRKDDREEANGSKWGRVYWKRLGPRNLHSQAGDARRRGGTALAPHPAVQATRSGRHRRGKRVRHPAPDPVEELRPAVVRREQRIVGIESPPASSSKRTSGSFSIFHSPGVVNRRLRGCREPETTCGRRAPDHSDDQVTVLGTGSVIHRHTPSISAHQPGSTTPSMGSFSPGGGPKGSVGSGSIVGFL